MADATIEQVPIPWMPDGSDLELADGNTVYVRDSGDLAGRPVLVLLHGWMATADLNFGFCAAALAERFRVVWFDQHGHGRGRKSRKRFSFPGCADDVAAVLDALGIDRAIAVGYSMGGPIALALAHRHRDRAAGLVLCATAGAFSSSPMRRAAFAPIDPMIGATRLVPGSRLRRAAQRRFIARRATGIHARWIADELAPSDLTTVAQAGVALGRFDASAWCAQLDLPVASVVTGEDELVKPAAQRALARVLCADHVAEVPGGHTVCFDHPELFAPALVDACRSVAGHLAPASDPSA